MSLFTISRLLSVSQSLVWHCQLGCITHDNTVTTILSMNHSLTQAVEEVTGWGAPSTMVSAE